EVQKPLATVVIGGLVSATFLTLFVLPCLYILLSKKIRFARAKAKTAIIIIFLSIGTFFASDLHAQQRPVGIDSLIQMAKGNNLRLRRAGLDVQQSRALQRSAVNLPKTDFSLAQDPTSGGNIDNSDLLRTASRCCSTSFGSGKNCLA
ncbi:MAG: hypothetical protein EOO88_53545, partial [Pedobacter sp.]